MTFKITPIASDKESWENVAPIIVKSFLAYNTNIGSIKKWADKVEGMQKSSGEAHLELESRVDSGDAALSTTMQKIEDLGAEVRAGADEHRRHTEDMQGHIAQILRACNQIVAMVLASLSAGDVPEEPGACGETLAHGGDADGRGVDGSPHSALQAELGAGGEELRTGLRDLREAVLTLRTSRPSEQHQIETMQDAIGDLQAASERTLERLLSWRSLLKENTHAIDALGSSLVDTQGVVQELQYTQVFKEYVYDVVNASGNKLHGMLDACGERVDALVSRADDADAEVQQLVAQTRKQMEDRMTESSVQITRTVEKNLNLVNANLNMMHVKGDVVREDLDKIISQVPRLQAQIEVVAADGKGNDDTTRAQLQVLSDSVGAVSVSLDNFRVRAEDDQREARSAAEDAQGDLDRRLTEVKYSLSVASSDLLTLREDGLAKVSQGLTSLEHRVAKWVHALPLPAKVSEARLFSLEARLSQETDARLLIEQRVGVRQESLTPLRGAFLPHLSSEQAMGGRTPRIA